MIKTDIFIKSLLDKGLVDDALKLDSGYDVQYKGTIVSVRLDNKGGALIYNSTKNDVVEIKSGRLDDVLHRYIVQSLFGIQSSVGTQNVMYKDVCFVPKRVLRNSVVFEDSTGRKFTVKGSTPEAVLSFYNELVDVNADDAMVILSGFSVYNRPEEAIKNAKETDIELQLLRSSLNPDDYAVYAKSECIKDVGQTIVGNFLCSSADKISQITFEEDERKAFSSSSVAKRGITSSQSRFKNPMALRMQRVLSSVDGRKAVRDYIQSRYGNGLSVASMEQMIMFEGPSILKSANIANPVSYKDIFANYLRNCETVSFRLDSNKSILCSLNVPGKSIAKFRSVPNVAEIKNALQKEGYLLSELSDGLEFKSTMPVVSSIVNSCNDFVPVTEKMMNKPNIVSKVVGQNVKEILNSYGVNDEKGVFSSLVSITVN